MADPDFPKGAPVHLRLLARQSDHAAVDVRGRLRPQTSHHPPDLHGRAGIAPLAKHLVQPRGAQARILREGVADERQKRVEGTRAAHPAARAARLMLQRRAHRLMVDAEGGRDGPDLPMLAEREAPDLGALRGRDHHSSSGRRGATAPGSATGSPGRRPDSASDRGPAPGGRQGRGVWRTGRRRGKRDPSRGTGRDRRVDGLGDRGALPDCADGGPGRPAPSAGGPGSGNARAVGVATVARRTDREEAVAPAAGLLAEGLVHGVGVRAATSDWTVSPNRGTTEATGSVCRSSRRSRGSGGTRALTSSASHPYAIRKTGSTPRQGLWTLPQVRTHTTRPHLRAKPPGGRFRTSAHSPSSSC